VPRSRSSASHGKALRGDDHEQLAKIAGFALNAHAISRLSRAENGDVSAARVEVGVSRVVHHATVLQLDGHHARHSSMVLVAMQRSLVALR
jgi:hypothetical protein